MFPERTDRELLESLENPFEDHDSQRLQAVRRARQQDHDEIVADDDLEDTITTPADELPVIRGYDRTIKGMPAAPQPRAALPAMESEPVRVGRGSGYEIEFEDDDDLRLGSLESINLADNDRRRGGADPHPRLARRRSGVRFRAGAVGAARGGPARAAPGPVGGGGRGGGGGVCRRVTPAAAAAGGAARQDPGGGAIVPALAPVISTPIDRPVASAAPADHRRERGRAAQAAAQLRGARPAPKKEDGPGFIRLSEGDFKLPSEDLLEYVPPPAQEIDKQGLYDMAARLEQAMSNYGVKGDVSAINMGPVVTMYEFAPAPGTRTGKIAQLENDLAMALEAQAVRIVAPIPGKAVVGVEVPNKTRQTVYLKEILADDAFRGAGSKLQIALGKDIKGNPVSVNLAKMPHLLVAGTTGSGKSVTVNGMITSLLYNATPEEVRFIMVDPKMLELSIYEGIPHLLLPVVTDPKKANLALRWAVDEMERRYELLAKSGVRDISSYNAKVEIELGKRAERKSGKVTAAPVVGKAAEAGSGKAKRLKVVIAGPDGTEQEVEVESGTPAGRGRPGGHHHGRYARGDLHPVGRRPGRRPGPEAGRRRTAAQAALHRHRHRRVRRPHDGGAEGRRDLGGPHRPEGARRRPAPHPGDPAPVGRRHHRPDQGQLPQPHRPAGGLQDRLAHHPRPAGRRDPAGQRRHAVLRPRDQAPPHPRRLPVGRRGPSGGRLPEGPGQAGLRHGHPQAARRGGRGRRGRPGRASSSDALYDQAVAIVCETRQASVCFIQRRLQIGYNRSARMVEQMERDGIVGPANGIKPREVLAPAGEYLNNAS